MESQRVTRVPTGPISRNGGPPCGEASGTSTGGSTGGRAALAALLMLLLGASPSIPEASASPSTAQGSGTSVDTTTAASGDSTTATADDPTAGTAVDTVPEASPDTIPEAARIVWSVREKGGELRPIEVETPADSLEVVARRLVRRYQERGFYRARITRVDTLVAGREEAGTDSPGSVRSNGRAGPAPVRLVLHLDPGSRSPLERIDWVGVDSATARRLEDVAGFETGEVLPPERLHAGLDRAREWLRREGHPAARVRVGGADLEETSDGLVLRLSVDLGSAPTLRAVRISDSLRTGPHYLARLAGYRLGEPVDEFDPETVRRRLHQSGLFEEVGRPRLELVGRGDAELHVPVVEVDPGSFDLVLGYQPATGGGAGRGAGLVGSGHLALRNLFGGGREFQLDLNRMPGRVSRLRAGAGFPYPFELPVRLRTRFEGYQQDSTYGSRDLEIEALTRLGESVWSGITVRHVAVRAGAAAEAAGVRAANGWFAGVRLRWDSRDRVLDPGAGTLVEVAAEEGRKVDRRGAARGEDASTSSEENRPAGDDGSERQHRITVTGRSFWTLSGPHVLVGGVDLRWVGSRRYALSDLYRVGGATSLRGFNEEQFAVDTMVRTLLEYRLRTDRRSYVFAFIEGGYLHRPAYGSVEEQSSVLPAFGVGLQMETDVGLVNLAYAANTADGPTEGRIHVRLRLGL